MIIESWSADRCESYVYRRQRHASGYSFAENTSGYGSAHRWASCIHHHHATATCKTTPWLHADYDLPITYWRTQVGGTNAIARRHHRDDVIVGMHAMVMNETASVAWFHIKARARWSKSMP